MENTAVSVAITKTYIICDVATCTLSRRVPTCWRRLVHRKRRDKDYKGWWGAALKAILFTWRSRKWCRKVELQSLAGKLQHACTVVHPGRSFIRAQLYIAGIQGPAGRTVSYVAHTFEYNNGKCDVICCQSRSRLSLFFSRGGGRTRSAIT